MNDISRTDLALAISIVPTFFLFFTWVDEEFLLVAILIVSMFYVLISAKWHLRRSIAFWLLIAIFIIIHTVAILLAQMPAEIRSGLILFPIFLIDLLLMFAVVSWLERRVGVPGPDQS